MCIYQIKFLFYMLPIKYNIIGLKSSNVVVSLIKTGILLWNTPEVKQAIFQSIFQHFLPALDTSCPEKYFIFSSDLY